MTRHSLRILLSVTLLGLSVLTQSEAQGAGPNAVTNLTVSNKNTSFVSLTWIAPPGNMSYFIVQWMGGSVNNSNITLNTSYTVTGLTAGGSYTFTVTAVAADNVTTGASTQISGFTTPGVVTSLTVSNRTTSSVYLTWNVPPGNMSYFTVQWAVGNGPVATNSTKTMDTSYNVTGLIAGGSYTFTVTAICADNLTTGAPAQISVFTTPGAVTNLIVSSRNTSSVSLTWTGPPGNTSYFTVQWTGGSVTNTSDTTYTLSGLTAEGSNTVIVTVVAADNLTTGASTQTLEFTQPATVSNITVSNSTNSSVSLSWNAPPGNASYFTGQWTGGIVTNSNNTSDTYYTVTGLTAGVNYTFTVTAVAADGQTVGAPTQISTFTKPGVVANLSVSNKTTSSVYLTWNMPPGNMSYFTVQWTGGSVNNSNITSNTSHTVNALTAGVNYTFTVTAVAVDGKTAGEPTQISAFTKPDAVTNLTVSKKKTSSLDLTWIALPGNMSYFTVQWIGGSVNNSIFTSNTSYTVTGLTAGVNYTFIVTAVAADNLTTGASAQTSAFTTPGAVTNLNVSKKTTSSLYLTWIAPSGNMSYFTVQWIGGSVNNSNITSNTSFTVTGLTAGVNYTFTVTAVAADNLTTGASTQSSAFTMTDAVTNLNISKITTSSVSLIWNAPPGNMSYFTVQWIGGSVNNSIITSNTLYTVTGLTAGVNYTFTVTAVAADNVTTGASMQISAFTTPNAITNLSVSDKNTSSVSLTWHKPTGNTSYFTVQWTGGIVTYSSNTFDTSYTVTGLTAGENYTFTVTAVAADGKTVGAPTQISAFTKPDIISNRTILNKTTSSVHLTWDKPPGKMSHFIVKWTGGSVNNSTNTSNTSYNVTGLTAGVNYTFTIIAVAADNLTTGAPTQISAFTKPGLTSDFNVTEVTTSSLFLKWNEPVGQRSFFTILWSSDSMTLNSTTSNTSFNITNLSPGVNYTILIFAVSSDNITQGEAVSLSVYTKPDTVSNLTAVNVTMSSISLYWSETMGIISHYVIQCLNFNTNITEITERTRINITNLTPGMQYTFKVFAVAADYKTEGIYSYISTYTIPCVTSGLSVTEITTSSLFLNWNEPVGQRSFFTVQWSSDSMTLNSTTSNTSFNITNLSPGVNYTILIFAVASDNITQGEAVSLSVYTKPVAVSNLSAVNVTMSSISLYWSEAMGIISHYVIQYILNLNFSKNITEITPSTKIDITNLTPGMQYTFKVFAVAADNKTEGIYSYISTYTKPGLTSDFNVTEVTTSSLFLNWTEPVGQRSFFTILWSSDSMTLNSTTSNTSFNITNLSPGVNYTILIFAVSSDNITQGEAVSLSVYTKPDAVSNLTAVNVTTSSISLYWSETMGIISHYVIQCLNFNTNITEITERTRINITNLTPGMQYTFKVFAVAADYKTEGIYSYISTYTIPCVTSGLSVTEITTSSLFLNWNEPVGQRSFFTVQWSSDSMTLNSTTSNTSFNITNLSPGVNYTILIFAVASDNITQGEAVSLSVYTKPDTVSNLTAVNVTMSSISLYWSEAMGIISHYVIQYILNLNFSKNITEITPSTKIDITNLTPGMQYTFKVFAVAADNKTEGIYSYISTYTKPGLTSDFNVTEVTTSSLFLDWNEPVGQRSFFTILWSSDSMTLNSTTSNTSFNITNLSPGVNYTILIFAVASDNITQGEAVSLSVYTKPDTVSNLTAVNVTTSSISLYWSEAMGKISHYVIQCLNFNTNITEITERTRINITNLTPGMQYTFKVFAVAADNKTEGIYSYISTYTIPCVTSGLSVTEITTSSLFLNWNEPVGQRSFFTVQWSSDSMTLNSTTSNTSFNITNLSPGVNYTILIFAVSSDNITQGEAVSLSVYTKPDTVSNLTAVNVTTSSISLYWSEAMGKISHYVIQCLNFNTNITEITDRTRINITNLTPGMQYTFKVFAVAADNKTEGIYSYISTYTKPGLTSDFNVTEVTTSSLFLNWNEPVGQRSFFTILWSSDSMTLNSTTSNTSFNITNLSPGVNYTILMYAVSSDNITQGEAVSLSVYTKPDTVSNLTAVNVTTSSISLYWSEAMGKISHYVIQCLNFSTDITEITDRTRINITNLTPGMQYTFKVFAVAADNKTEGIYSYISTYTKPDIVRNLISSIITTTSVFLMWDEPLGQSSYFIVYWMNSTTHSTSFNITDLQPGTKYTFGVSAVAADNKTEGSMVVLSTCTGASPVFNITCEGPNRTATPLLQLTWINPPGSNQGFNITVNTTVDPTIIPTCQPVCNLTFSQNLQYFSTYSLNISTLGCGESGQYGGFTCKTGITEPPVPSKPEDILIAATPLSQTVVNLQFSYSLLNGTNGPIEAYGVLLSTDNPGYSSSDSLKMTYNDWKQKKTKTYLTVLQYNENQKTRTNIITVEIGNDNDSYVINNTNYTNGPLTNQDYRVALVLFTSMEIKQSLVDIQQSIYSVTPFASIVVKPEAPSNIIPIILGVLLPIILFLIIAIIVLVIQKRRITKDYTDIPVSNLRTKVSIPVRVEDFEAYFKKQQLDSNCGFAEQYEDLKVVGTAQTKNTALALENKGKNRYNNVLPYDSSRVKLSTHGSPFDDYINANYISGYNCKKAYIAAQGPLPATVNEFWRMIWEKHTHTIVMLTKCYEQGRVKCEKYWPQENKLYSNILVTTTSEIELEDWTIREFTIKNVKTAETRNVRQFHFTAWPDHGVPDTTEVLINFRHLVREHMDSFSRNAPAVVHCSAGVGRTGTFIALDHLIFQIERESMADIYGIVHDMRMHRPLMVQTEDQFVFLNQCAYDIIKSRVGTNVDLIYQNTAAFAIYENVQ